MSEERGSFPRRIVVEMTNACNLSCPMCPRHHSTAEEGFMAESLWRRLITEAVSRRAIVLPFWRGESLLHPRFAALMEEALAGGAQIHMATNGHLLDDEAAAVLARCEFITFSIHTERGFERAVEYLRSWKGAGQSVQASVVRGETSVEGRVLALAELPDLGGFDALRLYEEHSRDGVFGRSSSPPRESRRFCRKLDDTLVIAWDGTISRCNHLWRTEEGPGADDRSIVDVWQSETLEKIRRNYPDSLCADCDQWSGHTCGESWRVAEGGIEHLIFGGGEEKHG